MMPLDHGWLGVFAAVFLVALLVSSLTGAQDDIGQDAAMAIAPAQAAQDAPAGRRA